MEYRSVFPYLTWKNGLPQWQPGPGRQGVGFREERVPAVEGLAYRAASDKPQTLGHIQLWVS